MIASLVAGIAFAIGHHVFYKSLQGTEVRSAPYQFAGWQITPQQLHTAAGTAFAFAVKASLVLAISMAYMQLVFRAIAKVDREMACINSGFSGLGEITSLFGLTTLWTQPLLASIALTAWLLPIAAIITQPHFPLKIANYRVAYGEISSNGPAIVEASRIIQAVALGGSILPMVPPAVNSSRVVTMRAPRLACDNANDTLLEAIKDNLATALRPRLITTAYDVNMQTLEFIRHMFSYMSWTGRVELEHAFGEKQFWQELPFRNLSALSLKDDVSKDINDESLDLAFDRGDFESKNLLYVAFLPRLVHDGQPASLDAVRAGPNIFTADGDERTTHYSEVLSTRGWN
ncbi:hypothetical protein BST61_g2937 [Cercospora zeina]